MPLDDSQQPKGTSMSIQEQTGRSLAEAVAILVEEIHQSFPGDGAVSCAAFVLASRLLSF